MKVIWQRLADQQLQEIYERLTAFNLRAAQALYAEIFDRVDKLSVFPEMAAMERLLEEREEKYRSLVIKKRYKVIYRVDFRYDEIHIVSVWDCRRDPQALTVSVKK